VQNGTLRQGDLIIAGTAVGRVRVMTNDKGAQVQEAGPSVPVEITGLTEVPAPGDEFNAVEDERMARQLVEQRRQKIKDDLNKQTQKVTLDNLFSKMQQGEMKELDLVVKADVQGSAEALKAALEKISNDEVRVRVIHAGVGAINESDVLLAYTSNAIIIGFNVRPNDAAQAASQARQRGHADVPRHLRRHQRDRRRHEGHARAEVQRVHHRPRRGAPDLQGLRHRHRSPAASSRTARSRATPRCACCATTWLSTRASSARCSASRTPSRRSPPATSAACPSRSSTISGKATSSSAS
jgi:hypothetical protein